MQCSQLCFFHQQKYYLRWFDIVQVKHGNRLTIYVDIFDHIAHKLRVRKPRPAS